MVKPMAGLLAVLTASFAIPASAETWTGQIRCETLPGMTTIKLVGDFEVLDDGTGIVYRRYVHNPDAASTTSIAETGKGALAGGEMTLQGGASGPGYSYTARYQGEVKGASVVLTGEQIWSGRKLTTQPFHRQCQILLGK